LGRSDRLEEVYFESVITIQISMCRYWSQLENLCYWCD